MAQELILLDTSVLIEYFRKEDKRNSYFYKLTVSTKMAFAISVISEFEILIGATAQQQQF